MMDSGDEQHSFHDANDFFSYEGDSRDPLELSFSKTFQNLKMCPNTSIGSGEGSPNSSTLQKLIETTIVPKIQKFLKTSEQQHTQLINTTVDFLKNAESNQIPFTDHQLAVIEKSQQLAKLCSHLAMINKQDKLVPIQNQVAAAVVTLLSVETGIKEQISETKLQMKLMQEAIHDVDKFAAHMKIELDDGHNND